MSEPYLGEIRMFGGTFAPLGWAFCDGSLRPISEYDALFVLLGTTYGGDGQSTFGLPDLRGRVPVHYGTGGGGTYVLGEMAGSETVTLTTTQIPIHSHPWLASAGTATSPNPNENVFATAAGAAFTSSRRETPIALAPQAVTPVGGSQPHDNMMPFQVVNFIISMEGIFPTQG